MNSIKKYVVLLVFIAGIFASCTDYLETQPTDQVSGTTLFQDVSSANTAIQGVYSVLWNSTPATGNQHQAVGFQSTLLAQDMMGDDAVMTTFDFYIWDYNLDYFRQLSTGNQGTASRNYNVWAMMYYLIANLNYIIAAEDVIGGNPDEVKNIIAQAYAMRAFCYFELIQMYQFTYLGNENKPGVPIYTEPTRAGDQGKPRGTVTDVYTLINSDMKRAIEIFEEIANVSDDDELIPLVQKHCSMVDYYVAKGFEARIALVQGRWQDAYNAAEEARKRPGSRLLNTTAEITGGLSRYSLPSTLWAMEVIVDQSHIFAGLYNALDGRASYGSRSRKCVSRWLYDRIANPMFSDIRSQWFLAPEHGAAVTGVNVNYGQMKRRYHTETNWTGDFIFMRTEEMLLIQAEAQARLGNYGEARALLIQLSDVRMTTAEGRTAYSDYLSSLANAATMPELTNVDPTNVLEEVILQRRIEMWGEIGRIKDILRLKQGYDRDYPGSNHVEKAIAANTTKPENGAFLFKIPQTEIDGNENITTEDQNPTN